MHPLRHALTLLFLSTLLMASAPPHRKRVIRLSSECHSVPRRPRLLVVSTSPSVDRAALLQQTKRGDASAWLRLAEFDLAQPAPQLATIATEFERAAAAPELRALATLRQAMTLERLEAYDKAFDLLVPLLDALPASDPLRDAALQELAVVASAEGAGIDPAFALQKHAWAAEAWHRIGDALAQDCRDEETVRWWGLALGVDPLDVHAPATHLSLVAGLDWLQNKPAAQRARATARALLAPAGPWRAANPGLDAVAEETLRALTLPEVPATRRTCMSGGMFSGTVTSPASMAASLSGCAVRGALAFTVHGDEDGRLTAVDVAGPAASCVRTAAAQWSFIAEAGPCEDAMVLVVLP